MRGFFSNKTPQESLAKDPCEQCKLYEGVRTPKMPYSGGGRLGVLIIGEGPGRTEDEQGIQFVGEAGQLLQLHLDSCNLSLHDDFWLINAVNCRPPANRTPTLKEIKCCRPNVENAIAELKPRVIWLFGKAAIQSMYAGRFSRLEVSRWHRQCIPDHATGAWIVPMYHPSFALRSNNDQSKLSVFEKDIRFAVSCIKKKPPIFPDLEPCVKVVTDYKTTLSFLMKLLKFAKTERFAIAFDYETSSTKPFYSQDQKIWCCAISIEENRSVAFPVSYTGHFNAHEQETIIGLLSHIMQHKNILKVAHNLQFEDLWTRAILKTPINSWHWCTMNAAHVLDCRQYYCGLKYQSYIHFGVDGYEQPMQSCMRGRHEGTRLNTLDMAPLADLLKYNAMDALLTRLLYEKQYGILNRKGEKRSNAFRQITLPGIIALNDATYRGISMHESKYDVVKADIWEQMRGLEKQLLRGEVAFKYRKKTGKVLRIEKKDFGKDDLKIILYEILQSVSTKQTATGQLSVDQEVVEGIDHPWAKALVKWRKLNKLVNTYLAGFTREISPDGKMHPFFYLHTTRTYRGSSADPNFQNIPNRDETAKKATRQGIMPRKGRRIVTVDYGSQEVRVAAILSQDKKLKWYCSQSDSDMHLDISCEIWAATPDLITKEIRFHAKGGFVFAEIYGSYYVACATSLWDNCMDLKLTNNKTVRDHLRSAGVLRGSPTSVTKMKLRGRLQTVSKHFAQFVEHVRDVESWFWSEFSGLRDWQHKMVDEYQRRGWVEMPFGFRRTGLLSNNKIFNSAIQGTAFHLLMWSYVQLNRYCKEQWNTDLMGQIHDEILYDLDPDELQEVLNVTERVMTEDIRKANPWVNVPLLAEPEATDIDQSWYYKKPLIRGTDGIWDYEHK